MALRCQSNRTARCSSAKLKAKGFFHTVEREYPYSVYYRRTAKKPKRARANGAEIAQVARSLIRRERGGERHTATALPIPLSPPVMMALRPFKLPSPF